MPHSMGRVEEVAGDLVLVRSRTLQLEGPNLVLGPEWWSRLGGSRHGVGFTFDLAVGDTVSLHWDWVCEPASPRPLCVGCKRAPPQPCRRQFLGPAGRRSCATPEHGSRRLERSEKRVAARGVGLSALSLQSRWADTD